MTYRIIQVHADKESRKAITAAIESCEAADSWENSSVDERISFSILLREKKTQNLLDKLQTILGHDDGARVLILPVDAALPKEEEEPEEKKDKGKSKSKSSISREEMYDDIAKGADIDWNYILLVIFSTIVAAIGLIENNVAVVIGAMVIAPLLGPNLALALSITLGDIPLIVKSVRTSLAGVALCIFISIIIGYFWPDGLSSHELAMRTNVGFDNLALALASGAAAVLSLTTGLSSVLVGVMVAVALLPPAAALGIMLGAHHTHAALGAFLLLVVNIICVNLAARLVFLFKGVTPRTWYEKKVAAKSTAISMAAWVVALLVLSTVIYIRRGAPF